MWKVFELSGAAFLKLVEIKNIMLFSASLRNGQKSLRCPSSSRRFVFFGSWHIFTKNLRKNLKPVPSLRVSCWRGANSSDTQIFGRSYRSNASHCLEAWISSVASVVFTVLFSDCSASLTSRGESTSRFCCRIPWDIDYAGAKACNARWTRDI